MKTKIGGNGKKSHKDGLIDRLSKREQTKSIKRAIKKVRRS